MPIDIEALRQLDRLIRSVPADKVALDRICRPHPTGPVRHPIGWMAVDPWFRENTIMASIMDEQCQAKGKFHDFSRLSQGLASILGLTFKDLDALFNYTGEPGGPVSTFEPSDITKADFLENLGHVIRGEAAVRYELLFREQRMEGRSATPRDLAGTAAGVGLNARAEPRRTRAASGTR